jgi:Txe/YoeB family toxin of toxin-antitoxin system
LVGEPRAWQVVFIRQAQKDARRLAASGLGEEAEEIIEILRTDSWQHPPGFQKLVGDLAGAFSRRINVQRRLVYQILSKQRTVKVLRMWTHYE